MADLNDVRGFYERGLERDRLAQGVGALELARTLRVLERYLPRSPAIIADIGGGPGTYAKWLLDRGYEVRLVDLVPLHVEQALGAAKASPNASRFTAEVGDARSLTLPNDSVDAVLLLGPLYHLPERADRLRALAEVRRICRSGGWVVGAVISRFASTLDGLRGGYLEDPAFAAVVAAGRAHGRHSNPTNNPAYFTTAYFHRPEELTAECAEAGLEIETIVGVEGPGWLLGDLEARLADPLRSAALFNALDALETEPSLLGVSGHLLAICRKP